MRTPRRWPRAAGDSWSRSDVIAIVSAVVSVAALAVTAILGLRSNGIAVLAVDVAESAQTLRPALRMTTVRIELATDLKGNSNGDQALLPPNAITDSGVEPRTDLRGARIEALLANEGPRASVIEAAEVEVTFAQFLTGCGPDGGGGGITSAEVDIALPQEPYEMLGTVTKPIDYEVGGSGSGGVSLTIGQAITQSGNAPLVIRVRVTLMHDGGERLAVGTFAVVDPGYGGYVTLTENGWQTNPSADQPLPECLATGARMVRQIVGEPGVEKSEELKSLDRALIGY